MVAQPCRTDGSISPRLFSLKDNKGNTVEKYIQQYRKNIENGNHEYTESLYKLIKSYKIN